jgi:hypothetical protein
MASVRKRSNGRYEARYRNAQGQQRGHFPGLPLDWFGSNAVHKARKAGA